MAGLRRLTLFQFFEQFPDEAEAEAWFERHRWPDGIRFCPECGSTNHAIVKNRRPMPYRCRDCRAHFSVRKGSVMQASQLPLRTWLLAIYFMTVGIKGTPSTRIHETLGVTQKTAWHLMHRIREGFSEGFDQLLPGPVEVDETYIGGKRKNFSLSRRRQYKGKGRGMLDKTPVVGVKDRSTNRVAARVLTRTDATAIYPFVDEHVDPAATIYTDESRAYLSLPYKHESVKHSAHEYVRGEAHTNGIESFWAMLKRGYIGTYHWMSPKHLHRYVREFAGRHNLRGLDTLDQMTALATGMVGRRLTYEMLVS